MSTTVSFAISSSFAFKNDATGTGKYARRTPKHYSLSGYVEHTYTKSLLELRSSQRRLEAIVVKLSLIVLGAVAILAALWLKASAPATSSHE
jgi:hypothetical protein